MTAQTNYPPIERMLRRPEVEKITGMARSTIYDGMAAGTFPKPVKIGARAIAWPESVIRQWIAERMGGAKA
jgi:prophage regulatory protein